MGIFRNKERVCIFIEGSNLYETAQNLRINIDYRKFQEPFKRYGSIVFCKYYTAIYEDTETGRADLKPLVDWLGYNNYITVTKEAKRFQDASGNYKIKGNMDIDIAVDMLVMAQHMDIAILVSGDGDFIPVVRELQRTGVKVVVVSSIITRPSMVSDALRRQANEFVELGELKDQIRRDL